MQTISEKNIQLNKVVIKRQFKELGRQNVVETLNGLLKSEAKKLTQANTSVERSDKAAAVAITAESCHDLRPHCTQPAAT